MGALLLVSVATGWKLRLQALLVNNANLTVFHLMSLCLMDRQHCFSQDDTPIDNEKFVPNTLTIEPNALTNYGVTLDRLMDCDM